MIRVAATYSAHEDTRARTVAIRTDTHRSHGVISYTWKDKVRQDTGYAYREFFAAWSPGRLFSELTLC